MIKTISQQFTTSYKVCCICLDINVWAIYYPYISPHTVPGVTYIALEWKISHLCHSSAGRIVNKNEEACRPRELQGKEDSLEQPFATTDCFRVSWRDHYGRAIATWICESYAPVILSRFGRCVVPTLLTPMFRRNWCWFRLGATLCHNVLRCCHAVATPGPRYCPMSTRLTSDTCKFSYVVLRYVTLPPRCSLAAATLSYAVPRNMMKHSVSQRVKNVA